MILLCVCPYIVQATATLYAHVACWLDVASANVAHRSLQPALRQVAQRELGDAALAQETLEAART